MILRSLENTNSWMPFVPFAGKVRGVSELPFDLCDKRLTSSLIDVKNKLLRMPQ